MSLGLVPGIFWSPLNVGSGGCSSKRHLGARPETRLPERQGDQREPAFRPFSADGVEAGRTWLWLQAIVVFGSHRPEVPRAVRELLERNTSLCQAIPAHCTRPSCQGSPCCLLFPGAHRYLWSRS